MDYFEAVAVGDLRLGPIGSTNDRLVQFDRYSLFGKGKLFEEPVQRDLAGQFAGFAVESDRNWHNVNFPIWQPSNQILSQA